MEPNSEIQYFQELLETITGEPVQMVNIGEEPVPSEPETEPVAKKKKKEKKEKVPKKDWRPVKESARYNKETDTYNHKPTDPEYFKHYWHLNNEYIQCDRCGRRALKLSLARHQKTNLCNKWSACIQNLQLLD